MLNKMKKTFITTMPDKAGAFLKASEIIAGFSGNITSVSYNKAVDLHTLFIEVNATKSNFEKITDALYKIGYLTSTDKSEILLIEFKLLDVPGSIQKVLEVLAKYQVNISYMNSKENETEYQYFKMGLLIENPKETKDMLDELSAICEFKILDYNPTEKVLDSTVFYLKFASEIREMLNLTQEETNEFVINSNRIMQMLEQRNEKPFKTFSYVRKFAKFIVEHKGENFNYTLSKKQITKDTMLYLIEPPCGSNTFILENGNDLLFVDSGFPCYKDEMMKILYEIFPNFDEYNKEMILTHADVDHVGLMDIFKTVYVNQSCYDNFALENEGIDNFREAHLENSPYCKLSKIIASYTPYSLSNLKVIGQKSDDEPLSKIADFTFHDLDFEVLEGNGGHVKGENVLLCHEHKLAFSGDNLVNVKGFSKDQYAFNLLAPYLMTSVNVDSTKASIIRKQVESMTKGYFVCPGHGTYFEN